MIIHRITEARTWLNTTMLPNTTSKQHYNCNFDILCKKFHIHNMLRNKLLGINKETAENGLKNRIWAVLPLKI